MQVPATFQYLDVHMLDDQDNPNLEYHIEGRIEDNSGMSPGHAVVKPDFLSACGVSPFPCVAQASAWLSSCAIMIVQEDLVYKKKAPLLDLCMSTARDTGCCAQL